MASNGERVAKNTIYLYMRTGVTMLVSLYTSRIVLNALGVEDFGIWGAGRTCFNVWVYKQFSKFICLPYS